MLTVIIILQLIAALFLILVVLFQSGKSQGGCAAVRRFEDRKEKQFMLRITICISDVVRPVIVLSAGQLPRLLTQGRRSPTPRAAMWIPACC